MDIAQGIVRWSVSSQKVRLIVMKWDSNALLKEEKFLTVNITEENLFWHTT